METPAVTNDAQLENQIQTKQQSQDEKLKDGNIVIPLRSVVIFLAASLASAVAFELIPLAGNTFKDALPLHSILSQVTVANTCNTTANATAASGPTFAIFGKSKSDEHLLHVLNVLQRFGYQRTTVEDDWDLLWAHDYPFMKMSQRLKSLQPHQKVNHIPGCGYITNKVDLSTTPLSFLPKAFKLPQQKDEFLQYAQDQPKALFVAKNNEHRNIAIKAPSEINLNASGSFVQEFIQNPMLVDGYKFDIGVYVLITSVDPLRIYIYAGDVLFRYCAVKYHPFDQQNVEKYVVGDDYLPTWEVPSLSKYYKKFAGTMRGSFDAYVRDQVQDPSVIWTQVEDIVRRTVLAKETDITRILRNYKTRNFFDLMRFDMIIDDRLRVYLMEVNMSPNLSSAHFKPNSLLYEQILYSAFNLLGIGSPLKRSTLKDATVEVEEMISADKNLASNINICAEFDCDKSCNMAQCQLCLPCLSGTDYAILEKSQREHLQKTDMKRIFPKPILNPENFDIATEVQNLSKRNAWLTRWYYEKCVYDRTWCL